VNVFVYTIRERSGAAGEPNPFPPGAGVGPRKTPRGRMLLRPAVGVTPLLATQPRRSVCRQEVTGSIPVGSGVRRRTHALGGFAPWRTLSFLGNLRSFRNKCRDADSGTRRSRLHRDRDASWRLFTYLILLEQPCALRTLLALDFCSFVG
jgi:hypothetical protein